MGKDLLLYFQRLNHDNTNHPYILILKTEEISRPIFLDETIVIIKKIGEKKYGKDIEKIKDNVVRQEKEKKLQMFSKAHYSKLEKTIQISFL